MDVLRTISHVINQVLGSSSYTSINMPGSAECKGCKAITIKTRTATGFTIASGSAGTTYFSVGASDVLSIDIAKFPDEVIFFAKADDGAPVLEVLLFNF